MKQFIHPAWSKNEAFVLGIIMGIMIAVMAFLTVKAVLIYPWRDVPAGWYAALGALIIYSAWDAVRGWRKPKPLTAFELQRLCNIAEGADQADAYRPCTCIDGAPPEGGCSKHWRG